MKTCSKCKLPKDESEFYNDKRRGRPHSSCKACAKLSRQALTKADPEKHNAQCKKWRDANSEKWVGIVQAWQARNPEKVELAAKRLRDARYHIDFDALWEAQKGLCACCGTPMQPKGRTLDSVCVDHDRACCPKRGSCGKCVRGLIHWACNVLLGHAHDDPKILRCAAEYIERRGQVTPP